MAHVDSVCEQCGCDYSYDEEASPSFCSVVCSQGCHEAFKNEHVLSEMRSCDQCLSLKAQGVIPAVCQHHLDMQFEDNDRRQTKRG